MKQEIMSIGVNDHQVDLFEGQYPVPSGMSYNSYLIVDEKIAVLDTVDQHFGSEWLENLEKTLQGRLPDYLVIHHMEPDHSANIFSFLEKYPTVTVVGNSKTFSMISQFFHKTPKHMLEVKEGDTLSLGSHQLTFIFAPFVHWPEVMMSYESKEKVLFSADAFGKFGALDVVEEWTKEARRYYFGIVGKYGLQVQNLLRKVGQYEIEQVAPLHGPILREQLPDALHHYQLWSRYEAESDGVLIAYNSVYGNTKKAVQVLKDELEKQGCSRVVVADLAREEMTGVIASAFQYGKLVLAGPTYNGGLFPYMNTFIDGLLERNYQNRTIGIVENGSWAPMVGKVVKEKFSKAKNLQFCNATVCLHSSMDEKNLEEIRTLASELL